MASARPASAAELREWLFTLRRSGVHPSLTPTRSVLEALGRPDRSYRAIQVVGTVGKGSTSATLAAILQASGLKVGLFTSPHLVHFQERMRVDGVDARPEEILEAFLEVEASAPWASEHPAEQGEVAPERRGLTFFEWAVTLSAVHFARKGCEVVVWEAGLGGRWDGTTAMDVDLSVVSRIDLDHTKILGASLEAIATEKAEAFRRGVPVVSAPQAPEVVAVLEAMASERDCSLAFFGEAATLVGGRYREGEVSLDGLAPSLLGAHQETNTGLAILAARRFVDRLGLAALEAGTLREGLASVRWPGRLQWLGDDLLCDGFHNRAGAEAVAGHLPELVGERPVHLVFGCLRDRDPQVLLEAFRGRLARLTLVTPVSDRALAAESFREMAAALFPELAIEVASDLESALPTPGGQAVEVTLVGGSLYLIGELLARAEAATVDPGDPLSLIEL